MKKLKLNKTIHKFEYEGNYYEIDWLTDATCLPNEKVCDIFEGRGKNAECVGQIIVKKSDSKLQIKRMAIAEINSEDNN